MAESEKRKVLLRAVAAQHEHVLCTFDPQNFPLEVTLSPLLVCGGHVMVHGWLGMRWRDFPPPFFPLQLLPSSGLALRLDHQRQTSKLRLLLHPVSMAALPQSKYYFAYGSNLHMKQMARRCPNSRYIGFGRLPNFRWQINQRGYANIVAAADGHWVHGLVYELDGGDEAQLDICEGVSSGAYEKQHMLVTVKLACCSLYRRPVSWLVARGGASAVLQESSPSRIEPEVPPEQETDNVLVYRSSIHVTDGRPRDEYIQRINWGLIDACSLGMEADYVRGCIRTYIPGSGVVTDPTPAAALDNAPTKGG